MYNITFSNTIKIPDIFSIDTQNDNKKLKHVRCLHNTTTNFKLHLIMILANNTATNTAMMSTTHTVKGKG